MSASLIYHAAALKQLQKLSKTEEKKVLRKITYLLSAPKLGKLLKGELAGKRSLRAWPYRIIYMISGNTITVHSIAPRKDVYR